MVVFGVNQVLVSQFQIGVKSSIAITNGKVRRGFRFDSPELTSLIPESTEAAHRTAHGAHFFSFHKSNSTRDIRFDLAYSNYWKNINKDYERQ